MNLINLILLYLNNLTYFGVESCKTRILLWRWDQLKYFRRVQYGALIGTAHGVGDTHPTISGAFYTHGYSFRAIN